MDSNSAEIPPSLSNGFGSYDHTGDSAKTYSSSEKQDRANTTKRRVPIYLRASTGSCHDICKYGRQHAFEEKSREPLRKRVSKSSSPNELKSVKMIASDVKNKGKVVVKHEPSAADYTEEKHSLSINISPRTKSCSPKLLYNSPRQSALSGNKTRVSNLSPAKQSFSISEFPEIIKREILLPSEKVEVWVEEGSSNENKMSRGDKKTCDQSVKRSSSIKPELIKVKPLIASGDSYGVQTGRKMTSSMMCADKASGTPLTRLSSRLSLGKTAFSKAREAGRVKPSLSLSLSLSSPLKYPNGTEKSNGECSEKTLHVIKTETENNALNFKPRKTGRVKSSYPPNRRKGTEDYEKTLSVIKTEAENNASPSSSSSSINSSRAKSPSLLSREEKDENEEIKDEIGNIRTVKENHIQSKSPSPSSHEDDDDEKIDYSNNEAADELIADKIISSEIENLQSLEENHDTTPTLSSHDDDDDDDEEIYPSSSSESLSHAKSSSLPSHEENDEEINGDKTISMEIGKVQENRKAPKKSKSVLSDEKNRSPVKLKFRRGKIIDLQPENNIPKRLKFRRARIGGNKTDDFVPDSKKSMETGNVKPVTPNKTLRKADSFISENKRSMDVKPGTPNKALRRSRSVVSEDKPVNLVRREKTVDLQTGNKSPTRLRFTRGRVPPRAEDGKSDLRKKTSIKKAGGKSDAVGFELSSRKVVLKHPEVERKKNGQVLLNNVIEETASKLVESRKSIVKALVGAFEAVISLQEPKTSSH